MSVKDHFSIDRWSERPLRIGHVVETNDDPTYGDGSCYAVAAVYSCRTCKALTDDPEAHADYHDKKMIVVWESGK